MWGGRKGEWESGFFGERSRRGLQVPFIYNRKASQGMDYMRAQKLLSTTDPKNAVLIIVSGRKCGNRRDGRRANPLWG